MKPGTFAENTSVSVEKSRIELERMLLAFERVGEGIVFADRAGGILLLNPAAGSWIGGTGHAAVGASLEGSIADPVLRGAIREDRLRGSAEWVTGTGRSSTTPSTSTRSERAQHRRRATL